MPISSLNMQSVIDIYNRHLKSKTVHGHEALNEGDFAGVMEDVVSISSKTEIESKTKIEHIMNRFGNGAVRNYKDNALSFYRSFSD